MSVLLAIILFSLLVSHVSLRVEIRRAIRQQAADRLEAIAEVKRTAEALALETARIAEEVQAELITRAYDTAHQVEHSTQSVLQQLTTGQNESDKTAREQIDTIEQKTTETNERLKKDT